MGKSDMSKINPTATLDTNVLVEHWKDRNKAAITRTLLDLNRSQGEMRRRWETSDEDESFSRYV